MKDWKSTASGILSFLIATFTTVTAFLAPYILAAPASTPALLSKISAGCTLGTALALGWVKLITNNADAGAVAAALAAPPTSPAATPTAATLATSPTPAPTPAPTGSGPKVVGVLVFALVGLMALTGCNSFERDTFNSLAASKAVIDQAQADYTAGTIKETQCSYAVINDAKAAQTLAVNAMLVYEQEKAAGSSLSAQTATVSAEVAAIVPLIVDVKALYSSPAGCSVPAAVAKPIGPAQPAGVAQ